MRRKEIQLSRLLPVFLSFDFPIEKQKQKKIERTRVVRMNEKSNVCLERRNIMDEINMGRVEHMIEQLRASAQNISFFK